MHRGILSCPADAPLSDAARIMARHRALAISGDEPLVYAAQLMADRGVSHLVVLEPASGYPVGILSTLDVAAVFAGPGSQA
ncbi:MAG: CBS domain-containing protein [Solirubrobacteraceae bacterium]